MTEIGRIAFGRDPLRPCPLCAETQARLGAALAKIAALEAKLAALEEYELQMLGLWRLTRSEAQAPQEREKGSADA